MASVSAAGLSSFLNDAAWARLGEKLNFSRREIEVARALLLHDQREGAIARRLRISTHTVHSHLEHLHAKLGVRTRGELIAAVLTAFLLMTAEPNSPLPAICGKRAAGRCPLTRIIHGGF